MEVRVNSLTRSIATLSFVLMLVALACTALAQSSGDLLFGGHRSTSKLSVSPTTLNYDVNIDKGIFSESQHFTIKSSGTQPLFVTVGAPSNAQNYVITFPPAISPAGGMLTIPGSISQEVEVKFIPNGPSKNVDATIDISSNASTGNSAATVNLHGNSRQKNPTATATATATATVTATATLTATPSPSPTVSPSPTASATPKPLLSGIVTSGNNPVANSSITAWVAGKTGYGTGATDFGFATATSAADGSFFVVPACPTGLEQIYLTAQGGNAGGGNNNSLMMIAVLGQCNLIGFGSGYNINEVTTADAVYALAQFLSTTNPGIVGAPSSNFTGLRNAFITAANLRGAMAPHQNLNSIANALAACNQTNGASSPPCTELFDCALPGAVFSAGACSGGAGSVTDTLAAALSIALNPVSVSVEGISDVAIKAPLYFPSLASAPHDWSMPLNFAPSGSNFDHPRGTAIDSASRVWTTNNSGSVTALNNDGTLFGNFAPAGSNFASPWNLAIDNSRHVWVTSEFGAVTALNDDGTLLGNFAPSGANLIQPYGVAIDSLGHVWLTNVAGNTVTALDNNGNLFGNFAPSGSDFKTPFGVAIDSSGHVWVANSDNNTVTALNQDGTLFGNFAPSGSNFDGPYGVAIDSTGQVWVTNVGNNTVTALNNDGTLFGSFAPPGSNFNFPNWLAIDSRGRAWIANAEGVLTALNNDGTLFGNFAPPGSNFNGPFGVAIDSSGNVWVTNYGNNTVTELVGVAGPVKTPFIGPPQLP